MDINTAKAKIAEVEGQIRATEGKIAEVEAALNGGDPYPGFTIRDDKGLEALHHQLDRLQKKKEQLRKEKEKLRGKELRLMPVQPAVAAPGEKTK